MKKIFLILFISTTGILSAQNLTEDQQASYYIGLDIAKGLKSQGLNVDTKYLAMAMEDVKNGKQTLLPADSMQAFMGRYMSKKMEQKKAANIAKGKTFLENNKKNPKVKTTASGLQYEVIVAGDNKNFPKAEDNVKVDYVGKLLDGTEFDSSISRGQPAEFQLNQVIPGWTEGVQLMSKGAKYRFYIPSQLAYGESGAGGSIGPNEVLIFDVTLHDFKSNTPPPAQAPTK